jgi:hypothetical protein
LLGEFQERPAAADEADERTVLDERLSTRRAGA